MADSRNNEFNDHRVPQSIGDDLDDSSSVSSSVETSTIGSSRISMERSEIGLTDRLREILVEQGDGDLLLEQNDREDRVLQWLQALDMQVMGACRADERLKPLLKLSAPGGTAEDCLLAHLSQHFDPSEVGMLARCFCMPLVSIRVGKINKQGTLLCPTATRGNLNLTLLPTSDICLSFIGDDGNKERLFTLSSKAQCSVVAVDEIRADGSGRSFHIKIPGGKDYFFWCSEKSKLLGIELLSKMRDILRRKPSIAELTRISESRLEFFANHLRTYLLGSNTREISALSLAYSSSSSAGLSDTASMSFKPLRSRHIGNQSVKANSPYQGSLSPRSSPFKEGLPRSLSSLRNFTKEKLRRRADSHLSAVDNVMVALPQTNDGSGSNPSENQKRPEVKICSVAPSSFLESFGKLAVPSSLSPSSDVPSIGAPFFSPYYCWCPQDASTLQFPSAPLQHTTSSIESSLLPPLSPFFSATMSTLLSPAPPLSVADIPTLKFPALLPDPLVRLPVASSQQIPTFTPLMCDPIVHIPVIDVCSSGQGYLVSAGPAISSTIPPLNPKLVSPLITETDSVVEKSARETLRLLISGSSQANTQLMDVLPAVLTDTNKKPSILAVGSRGLYSGTADVDVIANSIATMSLVSQPANSLGDVAKMHGGYCNLGDSPDSFDLLDGSSGLGESYSNDEGTHFCSNTREGTN